MTTRTAARWATYAGDHRTMVGQVVGPTTLGDYATAVSAEYDATVDRTRVGFAFGILNEDRNGVAYLPGGLA